MDWRLYSLAMSSFLLISASPGCGSAGLAVLRSTSLPTGLTSRLLEAVAPLVVGELAVLEGVTGVEERLDTGLVLVQVDGIDL